MPSKLDPMVPSERHDYYQAAAKRRRRAGWHRRGEAKPRRTKIDGNKLLAVVMGLATVTVLLCVFLPS